MAMFVMERVVPVCMDCRFDTGMILFVAKDLKTDLLLWLLSNPKPPSFDLPDSARSTPRLGRAESVPVWALGGAWVGA